MAFRSLRFWIGVPIVVWASSPLLAAEPQRYSACAQSADPPTCLVRLNVARRHPSPKDALEAVIFTGSLELIQPNRKILVQGARDTTSSAGRFLRMLGIEGMPDRSADRVTSSSEATLLAAVALAAAAQRQSDPFENPTVRAWSKSVDSPAGLAPLAAILWMEADTYSNWAPALTRPPGLPRIWSAIVATPPADPDLLVELATSGEFGGSARAEALALLRNLMQRTDVRPSVKAQAASVLARRYLMAPEAQQLMDGGGASASDYDIDGIRVEIAAAMLHAGYDKQAAHTVVEGAFEEMNQGIVPSFNSPLNLQDALESGSARDELKTLGDEYLRRGSTDSDIPEHRGRWLAIASDCYRRAGLRELALSTARKGVPFVAPGVTQRISDPSGSTRGIEKLSPRERAVRANGFGTDPVIALYRAGAINEALQTGYLSGYDRFKNAEVAGEARDVQWIIDDHSEFHLRIVVRGLMSKPDAAEAADLYRKLTTQARTSKQLEALGASETLLATLAALAGNEADMTGHLTRAIAGADRWSALELAVVWRQAQSILRNRSSLDHAVHYPAKRKENS